MIIFNEKNYFNSTLSIPTYFLGGNMLKETRFMCVDGGIAGAESYYAPSTLTPVGGNL